MRSNNAEIQMKMQMIAQQIAQIEQQLDEVNENISNIKTVREAIVDISKAKKDTEILAPVSNGIFVKTRLINNNYFLVNTGDGITVNKTKEGILQILDDQIAQMNKIELELKNNANKLNIRLSKLK